MHATSENINYNVCIQKTLSVRGFVIHCTLVAGGYEMIHLCCVFSLLQSFPWENGAAVSALPQNASVARPPSSRFCVRSRCEKCHSDTPIQCQLDGICSYSCLGLSAIQTWLFVSLSIVTRIKRIFRYCFSELPNRKNNF